MLQNVAQHMKEKTGVMLSEALAHPSDVLDLIERSGAAQNAVGDGAHRDPMESRS